MNILIACERSGTVRNAFAAKGHFVVSADLHPSDHPGNHFQGDVLQITTLKWDMMIAFPPCKYLSYAGNKYWNEPGRKEKREEALKFFKLLYEQDIPRICIENPIGYPIKAFRPPDQVIHPYFFGDRYFKRTCLWLKNLPPLHHSPVNTLFWQRSHTEKPAPVYITRSGKPIHTTEAIGTQKHREYLRAKTFQAIANAMADQWDFKSPAE